MKNKILSFIAVTAITLTAFSCSDDDSKTPQETNKLLGKWNFVQEVGLDTEGKVVETYEEDNGACPLDIYNFLENGTFLEDDYNYNTDPDKCENYNDTGKWKMEGDKFTLFFSDEKDDYETFKIKKLTEDTFEIEQFFEEEIPGDWESNVNSLKLVFKKIK